MRIKSYFARSIQSAMAEARRELGDDAMLLNSRRISESTGQTSYEVVFGLAEAVRDQTTKQPAGPPTSSSRARSTPAATPDPVPAGRGFLSNSLSEIQRQVAEIQAALPAAVAREEQRESREFGAWQDRLEELDLDSALIESLLSAARDRIPARARIDLNSLAEALRSEMEARLLHAELLPPNCDSRGIVLVGPAGAGKTTTLAKIAVQHGLAVGRRVHFITLDACRPAAAEHLRALALAMDVPFSREENVRGLVQAVSRVAAGDLVLVDTPGFAFGEEAEARECAASLTCLDNFQVHLVLAASMKRSDLLRYSSFYSVFKPSTLVLTRVDETEEIGGAVSVAITTGIPMSAHGCGPSLIKDLRAASSDPFLDRVFHPQPPVSSPLLPAPKKDGNRKRCAGGKRRGNS